MVVYKLLCECVCDCALLWVCSKFPGIGSRLPAILKDKTFKKQMDLSLISECVYYVWQSKADSGIIIKVLAVYQRHKSKKRCSPYPGSAVFMSGIMLTLFVNQ